MLLVLVSTVVSAAQAPKLAVPGFDALDVDPKKVEFFVEYLAQELSDRGCQVVTRKQIDSVLGLERQRQLLGCADSSTSCVAELAGALGVDALLVGNVARLDDEFVFTLKIISAKDARTLAQRRGGGRTDTDALEWLSQSAHELATELLGRPASSPSMRSLSWVPLVVAVGLGVASGALFASSHGIATDLMNGAFGSQADATAAAGVGRTHQTVSAVLLVAAVAAAGVAGALFAFGGPKQTVAVAVLPGGGAAVFAGTFP